MTNEPDNIIPRLMTEPRYRWFRHLILQLVLWIISINVFWDTPDELQLTANRLVSALSLYAVLNIMVYANLFVLIPRFLMRDRILIYLFCVIGLIMACLLAIGMVESFFMSEDPDYTTPKQPGILNLFSSVLSVGFLLMGTSAMALLKERIADSLRIAELESETRQSELAILKSQINPHFLFNMLNNSCLLIEKRRPEAAEVLTRLKELLRYQIEEGGAERITFSREINFLTDFLELEKIRRDKFAYAIRCEGNPEDVTLPPMLFIPFVENAAKHNNDSEKSSRIDISFLIRDDSLLFTCINSKPSISAVPGEVGGIGLKNIRRRLELLYPERHSLWIENAKDTYTVRLKIKI